jgi:hypothetical protein
MISKWCATRIVHRKECWGFFNNRKMFNAVSVTVWRGGAEGSGCKFSPYTLQHSFQFVFHKSWLEIRCEINEKSKSLCAIALRLRSSARCGVRLSKPTQLFYTSDKDKYFLSHSTHYTTSYTVKVHFFFFFFFPLLCGEESFSLILKQNS